LVVEVVDLETGLVQIVQQELVVVAVFTQRRLCQFLA
jgi:hypothetical protein